MLRPRIFRRALTLLLSLLLLSACSIGSDDRATVTPSPTAASGAIAAATPTIGERAASPASAPTPRPSPTASPTAAPTPVATPGSPATTAEQGELGQRAMATVRHLAGAIGSRPAGSAAEREAAEWLQQQLAALGYQTSLQPFPVRSFEDQGATLSVESPLPEAIPVDNLQFGGSGELTAPVVYAGLGRPGDFPEDVAGKIVLVDRGEITFQAKTENALAAGAVGVIVANNEAGALQGTLGQPVNIPVVAVSREDGRRLRTLIEAGELIVRLTARTETRESSSQNVVGTLSRPDRPIIVVGGHYDSVATGPGANDNASGTAVTLELARALASEPGAEIRVVAFGAEEIGLVGSRTYVASLSQPERERITLMVNLDMVGVGESFRIGGVPALVELAIDLARSDGIESVGLLDGFDGRSDHASFLSAGIPAVFLHWFDDPNYHTADDRADFVRPELLDQAGRVAFELIQRLLSGQPGAGD